MREENLKEYLDKKVEEYNQPFFIKDDPVSVPYLFSKKQDREIAGFFAAVFAWGNRTTIIRKSKELMERMSNRPLEFCLHHSDKELQGLLDFKHRTFNATDLLYFIEFFKWHYSKYDSLEKAFNLATGDMAGRLNAFHEYFFSLAEASYRTRKHIPAPARGSTCKRINMFLRWMVRKDKKGVDFGIWKSIAPSELICPIDLHVAKMARRLGVIHRKQTDWLTAVELTETLRTFDPADPVKYDFALFGLGAIEPKIKGLKLV